MPSRGSPLPQRVEQIVSSDGVLQHALARGVVNQRALSRWLISTHGLGASEEAVLSALRRLRVKPHLDRFRGARSVIARSHLNVRSRTCQLLLPKSEEGRSRLPKLFDAIDSSKGELLHLVWGEFGTKILIDEANLEAVESLFGSRLRKVVRNLVAVTVVEPEDGAETPGILAILTEALAFHGVNIIDAVYGYPDYTFFVKDADGLRSYEALQALITGSPARHR